MGNKYLKLCVIFLMTGALFGGAKAAVYDRLDGVDFERGEILEEPAEFESQALTVKGLKDKSFKNISAFYPKGMVPFSIKDNLKLMAFLPSVTFGVTFPAFGIATGDVGSGVIVGGAFSLFTFISSIGMVEKNWLARARKNTYLIDVNTELGERLQGLLGEECVVCHRPFSQEHNMQKPLIFLKDNCVTGTESVHGVDLACAKNLFARGEDGPEIKCPLCRGCSNKFILLTSEDTDGVSDGGRSSDDEAASLPASDDEEEEEAEDVVGAAETV